MIGLVRPEVNRLGAGLSPIRDDSFTTAAGKNWTVAYPARYAFPINFLTAPRSRHKKLGIVTVSTGNRVIFWLAIGMALFGANARSAFAQRGRGFGFGPNRAQLATLKEVQAALKLSDE